MTAVLGRLGGGAVAGAIGCVHPLGVSSVEACLIDELVELILVECHLAFPLVRWIETNLFYHNCDYL